MTNGGERRRVPYRTLIVALASSAVGLVAVWIGALDLVTSMTFGTRVTAVIVLSLGVIAVSGPLAVAMLQRRASNPAGIVALAANASAAVLALTFVVLQTTIGPWRATTMAGVVLLVLNLWSCYALVAHARVKVVRPRLTTLVSLTATLGLIGFIRSDIYIPGSAPQLVALSIADGQIFRAAQSGDQVVPLEITLENKGSMRVHILTSSYDAYGRIPVDQSDDYLTVQEMREAAIGGSYVSRYIAKTSFELVQSDQLVVDGSWLEPGEVMSTKQLIRIPDSAPYDTVTVSAYVATTRGDRAAAIIADSSYRSWDDDGSNVIELPSILSYSTGTPFISTDFKLREASRLRELVRPPMMVTSYWILDDPEVTRPRSSRAALVHNTDDPYAQKLKADEARRLAEMYGAVNFFQAIDISLIALEDAN